MAASVKFQELIEHLRGEVSKFIWALEIVEMPVAIFRLGAFTGQVPADGKPAISREIPKQGELAEVAYPSDLPNLHRASKHITDGTHFSGAIEPQFCRLSRKSHKPTPAAPDDHWHEQAGI